MHFPFKNLLIAFVFCFSAVNAFGWVTLSSIFGEGMVLQRDVPTRIWGRASKEEVINISFRGKIATSKPNTDGYWEALLPPTSAGGPFELRIYFSDRIYFREVYVGEVFIVSGQSNMEMSLAACAPIYNDGIERSADSKIRLCQMAHRQAPKALDDGKNGNWLEANPKNVKDFSALGYLLAKKMRAKYKVPVGIIQSTWSGTDIDLWMPYNAARRFLDIAGAAEKLHLFNGRLEEFINNEAVFQRNRFAAYLAYKDKIPGSAVYAKAEWKKDLNTTFSWPTVYEPGNLANIYENKRGFFFLSKKVRLSKKMLGASQYSILLGDSDGEDSVFINGKAVGGSVNNDHERKYFFGLPPNKDSVSILIKLTLFKGKPGFYSKSPFSLSSAEDTILINGAWHAFYGADFDKEKAPNRVGIPEKPTVLYNAMIAPIIRYTVRGVVWYQGESNVAQSRAYKNKLGALIASWRSESGDSLKPFYVIQLPNYGEMKPEPEESNWAMLREAQYEVATKTPYVGIVNTIDLGEAADIHPKNKAEIAVRFLKLLEQKPDKKGFYSPLGPRLKSYKQKENALELSFESLAKNCDVTKVPIAISGENGKWQWAEKKVAKNKWMVSHPAVPNPKYIRYAWAGNPQKPFLYDEEGNLAFPFRTDVFVPQKPLPNQQ